MALAIYRHALKAWKPSVGSQQYLTGDTLDTLGSFPWISSRYATTAYMANKSRAKQASCGSLRKADYGFSDKALQSRQPGPNSPT